MKLLFFILFPILVIGTVLFLSFDHREQVKIDQHGLTDRQNKQIDALGELVPDKETILRFAKNKDLMDAAKGLFISQCASCHAPNGIGGTGPNLTDDKYLLVKEVTDIYDVINNGSIAKGMPPWNGLLSKTKLILLSSYVVTLQEVSIEETTH
ncbi:MAG: c-type cytochrome [Planctomycetes bacterium]|nr:c-type cytochrome [Planctomycetota bacterium]